MDQGPSRTEATDLRPILAIAAVCLALSCLPYLVGWLASTPEWQFEGLFATHLEDTRSYLAAMHQGTRGAWKFYLLYTPEEHEGTYLYLFYLILGRAAGSVGLPMIAAFHLARLLAGAVLLGVLYIYICHFLPNPTQRLVAYVLASLGSGLGWLLVLAGVTTFLGYPPIDFWLTDAYVFFTILLFPHGALAVAMLLLALLAVLRYYESGNRAYLLATGLSGFLLAVLQPLCVVLLDVIVACYTVLLRFRLPELRSVLRGRYAAALLTLLAAQSPFVLYYASALLENPIIRTWQAQNITPSPSPLHYLLGYGAILIPAALAAIEVARSPLRERGLRDAFCGVTNGRASPLEEGEGAPRHRVWLLFTWVAVAAILLYLPGPAQRRYAQGLVVPLAILAAQGLSRWIRAGEQRRLVLKLFVTFAVLSSTTLAASWTRQAIQRDESVFHSPEELTALDWLADNTVPEEVVLSSAGVGSFIPARIGHRVFWGHWCETAYVEDKAREVERFFDGGTDDCWRRDFLARYNVRYVFYGPAEQQLGDFNPGGAQYLQRRWQQGQYSIFEYTDARQAAQEAEELALFQEALQILEAHFYRELPPPRELTYAAICGVCDALGDPYTRLVEPAPRQLEKQELAGVREGDVGVWVTKCEEGFKLEPMQGSPAEEAGIQDGDLLLAIDGQPVDDSMDVEGVQALLRGASGTSTSLTIWRPGAGPMVFELVRREVVIPSVHWERIGDAGLIIISGFHDNTPEMLGEALVALDDAEGLILDLRDNPGGLLRSAVQVAGQFIEGVVLYEQGRDGVRVPHLAQGEPRAPDVPLVVLANRNTLSAAEVVAGALQAHGRAVLVGESTYGKGVVQHLYELSDGACLHVTEGIWLTPDGRMITEGLAPDIEVEGAEEQLNVALEWLEGRSEVEYGGRSDACHAMD